MTNISVDFIKRLKKQILASRYVLAKIANAESLKLYYAIGKSIDEQFAKQKWGTKVLDAVSRRLQQELPGLRGFSASNLKKMRLFYQAWSSFSIIGSTLSNQLKNGEIKGLESSPEKAENKVLLIGSSATNQLSAEQINHFLSISFSHHFEIFTAIKNAKDRWYYIDKTVQELWTVRQLRIELKNKSHLQSENLPNNFDASLTPGFSDKATKVFKDQYLLDFVNMEDADEEIDERVLEHEIVNNIKKFMMSLGQDFAFMGNQYRLIVDDDEYFIDLLFFHRGLQSLVAFDLKKGKFKPEYVGKMNFYLSALDDLIKKPNENPSIGIILCKEKNNKKVEYSFRDLNKPMGVATFKTSDKLPEKYKNALPSPEQLKKLLD